MVGILKEPDMITPSEEAAAFLTAAYIESSDEVETVNAIVGLFKMVKTQVNVDSDMDYLAALLCTGRILDVRSEMETLGSLNEMLEDFKNQVKQKDGNSVNKNDLAAALLTSSCIAKSPMTETIRSTVDFWYEVRERISAKDEKDYVAAMLATGRISTQRISNQKPADVEDLFLRIRTAVEKKLGKKDISNLEIISGLLLASYMKSRNKILNINEIVQNWEKLSGLLDIKDSKDSICAILLSGRLKDMNPLIPLDLNNINSMVKKVRAKLEQG